MNAKKSFKISEHINSKIILYAGILLRVFYVILGHVSESRQYDIGPIDQGDGVLTGHIGYIYYLNIFKHFTDFDPREIYQFNHPPLHHIIEAIWIGIVKLFTNDKYIIAEWMQIPTCIYSVILLLAVLGITKELKLGKTGSCIVMTIAAFHPTLIFMAGSINNDGLSFMFQFLSIYLTLKWVREVNEETKKSLITIIYLALSIALGMLTKLSTGLVAPAIALVFLYVFIKSWKDNKTFPGKLFIQYATFGIVCVPLALSWSIRCLIKFDMPINYIYALSEDSWQYIGDHSLMERFFIPNPVTLLTNLAHGSIGLSENLWIQLFRTAALGECDLSTFPLIAKLLLMLMMVANFVVAFIAFFYFVKVMIIGSKAKYPQMTTINKIFFIAMYVVLFASYVSFSYKYPHECSMNFRYIVPTLIIPAIALGAGIDNTNINTIENAKTKRAWLSHLALITYIIFSISTILIWSFY